MRVYTCAPTGCIIYLVLPELYIIFNRPLQPGMVVVNEHFSSFLLKGCKIIHCFSLSISAMCCHRGCFKKNEAAPTFCNPLMH